VTLANGVKAAALDAAGPNTCVAAFIGGGSSLETEETAGASKLLEYMAFSATTNRCGENLGFGFSPPGKHVKELTVLRAQPAAFRTV
jgi:predicted Zn-dependent peptidase